MTTKNGPLTPIPKGSISYNQGWRWLIKTPQGWESLKSREEAEAYEWTCPKCGRVYAELHLDPHPPWVGAGCCDDSCPIWDR